MEAPLATIIPLFLVCAATAVYGAETRRPVLLVLAKPLTTALLLVVVGWPSARFDWLIALGIVLSLWGDVILLRDSNRAFLTGLVLFLGAHLCYIAAFAGVARWSGRLVVYLLVVGGVSVWLVRRLWRGARGLRGPVLVYASAISAMVVTALCTRGGALPAQASTFVIAGATLFYVSDASLALNRFYRPIKHASLLTLGVYWLGQLGIALAARLGP
jgi:alkenylglycerophosphocholine hydrolase